MAGRYGLGGKLQSYIDKETNERHRWLTIDRVIGWDIDKIIRTFSLTESEIAEGKLETRKALCSRDDDNAEDDMRITETTVRCLAEDRIRSLANEFDGTFTGT